MSESSYFSESLKPLEKALELLVTNKEKRAYIFKRLTTPERIIKVWFTVKLEGQEKILEGYRVQFNSLAGPYKGGIRFHPAVSEEEVLMLAFLMMVKCSLFNLPFGGGKGGVIVDPKLLSRQELEEVSRTYIRAIADCLGPYKDVPAPDVNTNSQIIDWMTQEFRIQNSEFRRGLEENEILATFTGKSVEKGGIEGRTEATGFGGAVILQTLLAKLRIKNKKIFLQPKLTVAIQGFGNVGYHLTKFLYGRGFKIMAVSDSRGGVFVSDGLNPDLTLKCKKEKGRLAGCYCVGSVCDLKMGRTITNEQLLSLPVDILVPAALENVVTKKNASKIKAKIILEMANGGVERQAEKTLEQRGIIVIPDVLANAAGVTASYFEWKQNLEGKRWNKEQVFSRLESYLKKTTAKVWQMKEKYQVDLRTASYIVTLNALLNAITGS